MNSIVPKQFLQLGSKPIIIHSIEAFIRFKPDVKIIVVIPESQEELWNQTIRKFPVEADLQYVFGGETRFHSVKKGLSKVTSNSIVAVHDAVRPLVSQETLRSTYDSALSSGNGIPAIPVVDSFRILNEKGESRSINREMLRSIQTPQVFCYEQIISAYEKDYKNFYSDDASVVGDIGFKINLVDGNVENIKITRPLDLIWAEEIKKKRP
jgi:2-C-methyl-D-erythritol 4-phosphate cytidylyltransferase